MASPKFTILDFTRLFPDNDACLAYLFQMHHADANCPKCGRTEKYHHQKNTSHFVCQCGGHQISPKKGTIFEKSETDLVKWFYAIFLMSQSRNGVAAKEIERQCGVTYKTAWRMAKQIRLLMQDAPGLLSGEVEADETMIGGRRKGKPGRGAAGKTIVFGTVERDRKRVNAHVVPNARVKTLLPHIRDNIAKGARFITDEFGSYKHIARVLDMEHRTVVHSNEEWAKDDGTHTNTIEGFWSQLKRSLDGTHHVISPKYLSLYLSEFQFRYNYGGNDASSHLFDVLLSRVGLPHVQASRRIAAYR